MGGGLALAIPRPTFVFMLIDEALELHEAVSRLTRRGVHVGGILTYAWVIPYGVLTLAVASYLRFVLRQHRESAHFCLWQGDCTRAGR